MSDKEIHDDDLAGLFEHLCKLKERNRSQVEEFDRVASRFDRLVNVKKISIDDLKLVRDYASMNDLSFAFGGSSDDVSSMSSGTAVKRSFTNLTSIGRNIKKPTATSTTTSNKDDGNKETNRRKSGRSSLFNKPTSTTESSSSKQKEKKQQRRASQPEPKTAGLRQFLDEQVAKREAIELQLEAIQQENKSLQQENESLRQGQVDGSQEDEDLQMMRITTSSSSLSPSSSRSTPRSESSHASAIEMQKIKSIIDDLKQENKKLMQQKRLSLQVHTKKLDDAKQEIASLKRDRRNLRMSLLRDQDQEDQFQEQRRPPPLLEKETRELLEDFRSMDEEAVQLLDIVGEETAMETAREVVSKTSYSSSDKSDHNNNEVEGRRTPLTDISSRKAVPNSVNSTSTGSRSSGRASGVARRSSTSSKGDTYKEELESLRKKFLQLQGKCKEQQHQLDVVRLDKKTVEAALRSAKGDSVELRKKLEDHKRETEKSITKAARESDEREQVARDTIVELHKKLEDQKQESQQAHAKTARQIKDLRQELHDQKRETEKAVEEASLRKDELDLLSLQIGGSNSKSFDGEEKKDENDESVNLIKAQQEEIEALTRYKYVQLKELKAAGSYAKELEKKVERQKNDMTDLLKELDGARQAAGVTQDSKKESDTITKSISSIVKALEEDLKLQKTELKAKVKENNKLSSALEAARETIKDQSVDLRGLRNSNKTLSQELGLAATAAKELKDSQETREAVNLETIQSLQEVLQSQKVEHESLKDDKKKLSSELKASKESNDNQRQELESMTDSNKLLTEELSLARAQAKELKESKEQREAINSEAIQSLQEALQSQQAEKESLIGSKDELAKELSFAWERLNEQGIKMESLRQQLEEKTEAASAAEVSRAELEDSNIVLQETILLQQKKNEDLKQNMEQLSNEIELTKDKLEQSGEAMKDKNGIITSNEATIALLNEAKSSLEQNVERQSEELGKAADKLRQGEEAIDSKSSEIESLQQANQAQREELQSLEQEKKKLSTELEKAQERLEQQRREMDSMKQANDETVTELEAARAAETLAKEGRKQMEDKCISLEALVETLTTQINALQLEQKAKTDQLEKQSHEIEDLKHQCEAATKGMENQKLDLDALKLQHKKAIGNLEKKHSELDALRRQHEKSKSQMDAMKLLHKAATNRVDQQEFDISCLTAELDASREAQKGAEKSNDRIQSLKKTHVASQQALQQQCEALSKALDAKVSVLKERDSELAMLKKDHDELETLKKLQRDGVTKIKALEEAIGKYELEREALKEENELLAKQFAAAGRAMQNTFANQQTEQESTKRDNDAILKELASAVGAKEESKKAHDLTVKKLEATIDSHQAEIDDLKERNDSLSYLEAAKKTVDAKKLTDLQEVIDTQRAQIRDYEESLEQQSLCAASSAEDLLDLQRLAESRKVQIQKCEEKLQQQSHRIDSLEEEKTELKELIKAKEAEHEAVLGRQEKLMENAFDLRRGQLSTQEEAAETFESLKEENVQSKQMLLNDSLNVEDPSLTLKLEEAAETVKALREENQHLKESNLDLESEKLEMDILFRNQREEVESLKLKKDKLMGAVKFAKSACTELQDSVTDQKAANEEELHELKVANKELIKDVESLKATKKELHLRCEQQSVELETLKHKQERLVEDLKIAQLSSYGHQLQASDHQKKVTKEVKSLQEWNDSLTADLREARQAIFKLKKSLEKNKGTQGGRNAEMEELERANRKLQRDVRAAQSVASDLERRLENHKNEKEMDVVNVEEHITQLATLTQRHARDTAEIRQLQETLRVQAASILEYQTNQQQLEDRINMLHREGLDSTEVPQLRQTIQTQAAAIVEYQSCQQQLENCIRALARERDSLSHLGGHRTARVTDIVQQNHSTIESLKTAIESVAAFQDSSLSEYESARENELSAIFGSEFGDTPLKGGKSPAVTKMRSLGTGFMSFSLNDDSFIDETNEEKSNAADEGSAADPKLLNNIVDIVSLGTGVVSSPWGDRREASFDVARTMSPPVANSCSLAKGRFTDVDDNKGFHDPDDTPLSSTTTTHNFKGVPYVDMLNLPLLPDLP